MEKSGSLRVRAVLLNPTGYCANFRIENFAEQGKDLTFTNDTIVSPWKNSIKDDTEFERGSYKVRSNTLYLSILPDPTISVSVS